MEQGNDTLRERLLSRLPQPENLAAYREETASLLAKHARALRWDKILANTLAFITVAMLLFLLEPLTLGTWATIGGSFGFESRSAIFFFVGAIYSSALRNLRQPGRHSQGNQAGAIADPRTSGFAAKGSLTSVLIAQKTALVTARLEVPLIDAARAAGRQKQILHSAYPMDTGVHGAPKRSVQDDTVVDVCGFPPLTR